MTSSNPAAWTFFKISVIRAELPRRVVDNYRTPHTEKLHVVERWKLVNDGKTLEVTVEVEDPDTFNARWQAAQRYRPCRKR